MTNVWPDAPTWLAQLFEQHAQIRQEVIAMREVLSAMREEEQTEHAKINEVLASMDSTPTTPGFSERLRRLEDIVDTLKDQIDEISHAREEDVKEQAALGRKVHLTLTTLLIGIAAAGIPALSKLLQ